jgi:hypothetical protein
MMAPWHSRDHAQDGDDHASFNDLNWRARDCALLVPRRGVEPRTKVPPLALGKFQEVSQVMCDGRILTHFQKKQIFFLNVAEKDWRQ